MRLWLSIRNKLTTYGESDLPRRPCIFRQTDLTRALKGAQAAGIAIGRFEINKDGKIVVVAKKPESPRDGEDERNEWDDADDTPSTTIHKRIS
jgi:hypothetical protein